MKFILTIIAFFIFLNGFTQDSVCVIFKADLVKYRIGYIITTKGDTIHGSIYHESDTGIFFIQKSKKIETTIFGHRSRVPYITANSNIINSFMRNDIVYEVHKIPNEDKKVFLALLEEGPLSLYGMIWNYADKRTTDYNMNFSTMGTFWAYQLFSEADSIEEYYNIKSYYIQKEHQNQIIMLPKGKKNFMKAFLPLVKDNDLYIKKLAGRQIDYYNVSNLVSLITLQ